MNQLDDGHPLTLTESGGPPETRIATARQARSIYERLWRSDLNYRAPKRAKLNGLSDGNPPYLQRDLDNAGMSHRCNINFRVTKSYRSNGVGAFYDLFNEAPTYATVQLKKGTPEQLAQWSRVVTLNFDWLCRYERRFDYDMQRSQDEMVWHGSGPLVYQDIFDWRPTAILNSQLLVPDMTLSETSLWDDEAIVLTEYRADQLWRYIRDEKAATTLGWNVERAKQAVINASPESTKGGMFNHWEWHQQQLKNGSIDYAGSSNTISVAHVLCREFAKTGEAEGKITHVMVVRDSQDTKSGEDEFLFQKTGRFDNWSQCIHPMYYDRGSGGFHHAVTGMGTEMCSVMELQNRMYCNQADRAMLPKLMIKPTTSTAADGMSLVQNGDHLILSEGMDVIQTPLAGLTEEEMMFNRELSNLVSSNLSQYRSSQPEPIKGNPETATGRRLDASQQAALQKTQMNRYYGQMDALYSEMYRRAVNATSKSAPGGERAMEFIERCKNSGVPLSAMKEVEWVKASRVVGQGSEFLRKEVLNQLWITVGPGLPENGRSNLVDDMIATGTGPTGVERYNPKKDAQTLPDDQYAWAISQVADMKIGVPAVVTASQNPAVFVTTFLKAAEDAAGSVEQGGNPQEVASFLDLCGQAIAQHLKRLSTDPSRAGLVKMLTLKFKELGQVLDQLKQLLQKQAEEQQQKQEQMQQQQGQQQSDFALAKARLEGELALKSRKTEFGIQEKSVKTRQGMALKDATTAQQIRLNAAKHGHTVQLDQMQAMHNARMAEMQQEHDQSMEREANRNGGSDD
jgi:hypothetical protein